MSDAIEAVLAEARRLAYQFDTTYLRERNTCASEAEARTAGWLAVARATLPRAAMPGGVTRPKCSKCGAGRHVSDTWFLVERRDGLTPEYLVFTGANPPTWTTSAWRAQRFGRRCDADSEARIVAGLTGFKVEAIEHGFSGAAMCETRCESCGCEWLTALPMPEHIPPSPFSAQSAITPPPPAPAEPKCGTCGEAIKAQDVIVRGGLTLATCATEAYEKAMAEYVAASLAWWMDDSDEAGNFDGPSWQRYWNAYYRLPVEVRRGK